MPDASTASMPATDYYNLLGVSRSASAEDIRKAYKKLSAKYHPDRNPDDEAALAKYKEIQEAYSVLKDEEKRAAYDRYGENWNKVPQGGGFGGGQPPFGQPGSGPVDLNDLFGEGGIDLDDIFGGAFGGGRRQRTPRAAKGQDRLIELEVPFYTAAEGGSHDVRIDRGGKVERIEVKIPAGVDSGSVIRLAGLGHPGRNGGPDGDLKVTVKVAPHPLFRREGSHLHLTLPLSPAEAALGARVDVPTLSGETVVLTIPPGTSSGQKLRLREKGVPDRKTGRRGDLYATVQIVLPKPIPEAQQALYQQLLDAQLDDPRADLKN